MKVSKMFRFCVTAEIINMKQQKSTMKFVYPSCNKP